MPLVIHSDNASEFITAKNYIIDLFKISNTAKTHKELKNKYNIIWYHSTERSQQHNGVNERIMQTIKKLHDISDMFKETEKLCRAAMIVDKEYVRTGSKYTSRKSKVKMSQSNLNNIQA